MREAVKTPPAPEGDGSGRRWASHEGRGAYRWTRATAQRRWIPKEGGRVGRSGDHLKKTLNHREASWGQLSIQTGLTAGARGPGSGLLLVHQEALDPKFPRGVNTHSSSLFISNEL